MTKVGGRYAGERNREEMALDPTPGRGGTEPLKPETLQRKSSQILGSIPAMSSSSTGLLPLSGVLPTALLTSYLS